MLDGFPLLNLSPIYLLIWVDKKLSFLTHKCLSPEFLLTVALPLGGHFVFELLEPSLLGLAGNTRWCDCDVLGQTG